MHTSIYNTEQRSLVLDCFKRNKDRQLTASEIAGKLSANDAKIGLATIYRALEILEKQGYIRKFIDETGKKACWQFTAGNGKCIDHYHLKCEKCGKIVHLECGLVSELDAHMLEEHHFSMDRSKTVFYGLCGECKKS